MDTSPWTVHIILLHGCTAEIQDADLRGMENVFFRPEALTKNETKSKAFSSMVEKELLVKKNCRI